MRQGLVERVLALPLPRTQAVAQVLAETDDWTLRKAGGMYRVTARRLYRWCDGPQGDRYSPQRLSELTEKQLRDFEYLTSEGMPASYAWRQVRNS